MSSRRHPALLELGPFAITGVGQELELIPAGQFGYPNQLGQVALFNWSGWRIAIRDSGAGPRFDLQPMMGNVYNPPASGAALLGRVIGGAPGDRSELVGQVGLLGAPIPGAWPIVLENPSSVNVTAGVSELIAGDGIVLDPPEGVGVVEVSVAPPPGVDWVPLGPNLLAPYAPAVPAPPYIGLDRAAGLYRMWGAIAAPSIPPGQPVMGNVPAAFAGPGPVIFVCAATTAGGGILGNLHPGVQVLVQPAGQIIQFTGSNELEPATQIIYLFLNGVTYPITNPAAAGNLEVP